MMSISTHRIDKPKRRRDISSTVRKRELASTIEEFGIKTSSPCGQCQTVYSECKVDLRSGKCAECIKYSRNCDLIVTRNEWEKMKNERRKLKQQINDSEATLQQLLLRRSDLLQQWVDLEEKASEAIFQEMKNIEELERLEHTRQAAAPTAELEIPAEDSDYQQILQMGPQAWDFIDGSLGSFLDR